MTVAGILAGCSQRNDADRRPSVTVSIPPQENLLRQIVGDSIDINCLMVSGSNPESFEPGVSQLREVDRSDALLLIGNLGFEQTLVERIRANNPHLPVYNTSEGVSLIYGTHSHDHSDHRHHHDDAADPHTWTSARNARIIAANMLKAVSEIDPANTGYYITRHAALDRRLDSIDRSIAGRLAPVSGKAFLVWHPSLSYFARDYGLEQISIGQEHKESSVKSLQHRIDLARQHNADVFFLQQEFDSRQAEAVNSGINATTVTINPMSPDWEQQLNIITDALEHR